MKPVVGVMQAWSCIVISVFAIVILSIIGALFQSNNHALLGGKEDPEDGAAVAATVFSAVVVYAVFIVGCGFQAYLHFRDNRRGAISLLNRRLVTTEGIYEIGIEFWDEGAAYGVLNLDHLMG